MCGVLYKACVFKNCFLKCPIWRMNYNGHSIYHLEEKPRKIMEPESLIISAERTEHFFFQTRTVYIIVNRRSSPDHSKHSLVIFSHYPVGVGTWGKSDQLSECRVSSFVNMLQLNSDYYFWKIGYSFLPTDRNYTIFFFFLWKHDPLYFSF